MPKTVELVQSMRGVNAAMFALLPPGSKLGAHRDPFAGSLRHLGLVTPNADTCRIIVDGEPYFWRNGETVMFDGTFIHTAENLIGKWIKKKSRVAHYTLKWLILGGVLYVIFR